MTDYKTYDIYYDKEADFLEIFFGEPSESYAEEIEPGVFIRRDDKTNEIRSMGILSFKKRIALFRKLLIKMNLSLPLEINVP